ncbi:putative immunity protein [Streptomyces sp. NBC_00322]|uniref:putative immunity protein n=1 Tax=Streptomyces sp. NBC_00322 TaxID=2975712 RepID=UPI002E2E453D|nr:hypothetical protein [Streptomyces sp. NBC_00322]
MAGEAGEIALNKQDLREVTAFAAACAEVVLEVSEADQPDDSRLRDAIGAAWEFARGGERGNLCATQRGRPSTQPRARTLRLRCEGQRAQVHLLGPGPRLIR